MWYHLGAAAALLAAVLVGYLLGLIQRRPRALPGPMVPVDPPEQTPDPPLFHFAGRPVRRTFEAMDYVDPLWCVREHPLEHGTEFVASKLIAADGTELGEAACCVEHLPPYAREELDRVEVDG